MSEQPTPRTDAKFDLRNEMREAREFVNSSPLFYRFIDGTPLENDVACWIANAVIEKKDFVRGLERELAERIRLNVEYQETIRQLRSEAAEWTTDDELVSKAHKLERELAEARAAFVRVEEYGWEIKEERDQWREVAEELMGAVLEQETPSSVARIGKATLAILDLKEASK